MKNIIVTGGAGYIGSHVCKALKKANFNPITIDNLSRGNRQAVKWGPFEKCDILNLEQLTSVFIKYKPIAIMHFAAYAYVGESCDNPNKYYVNNVIGSINILHAMINANIKKIIFSSSCATYGIPDLIPIIEKQSQNPINPYGNTKLIIEQALRDYQEAHKISYIGLRYFNAAGADPDLEIGELHNPETHLIPIILEVAKKKRKYINIFGNNYDTSDGTCIRDYIHVSDLANAHVKALQHLIFTEFSDFYNLGNASGFSNLEVVRMCEKVTGVSIPVEFSDRREGDPAVLIGSSEKFQEATGWRAQYSNLEFIIKTAWAWENSAKFFES